MPGYLTLFLTAALLFKPCIAFGSSVDDDDNPESILIAQIARRSGDPALFLKDQQETFKQLSCEELSKALVSKVYDGVLSDKTDHGKTYKSIGPNNIQKIFEGTALRLCTKNLILAPLNIIDKASLVELNLEDNNLRIPPNLSHLINLQVLNLSKNQLTRAPDISMLSRLFHLNLSENKLTEAPDIAMLSDLYHLNLSDNNLTEAPIIQNNKVISLLDISTNPLKRLPNFEGMTKLKGIIMPDHMCDDPQLISVLKKLNDLVLKDVDLNDSYQINYKKIRLYKYSKNQSLTTSSNNNNYVNEEVFFDDRYVPKTED